MALRNNLPPQLTSFVGREPQIAEINRLLGTCRLLTLTGAGGSGKTRLALKLVERLIDECEHGVYFVNLAPIIEPALVTSAIAQALGAQEHSLV
jgi:predicted ATPase